MIIIYCSKPQQNDAVTPTPQVHRSHTCMRALVLGHENILWGGLNKFMEKFFMRRGRQWVIIQG